MNAVKLIEEYFKSFSSLMDAIKLIEEYFVLFIALYHVEIYFYM